MANVNKPEINHVEAQQTQLQHDFQHDVKQVESQGDLKLGLDVVDEVRRLGNSPIAVR